MGIHLLHGCAPTWVQHRQSFRNYVPENRLWTYLKSLEQKYVPWSKHGINHHVLTVDDSTQGAARACVLARELGHHVILFVNPLQIIRQVPYFFSLLDELLDQCANHTVTYGGIKYELYGLTVTRSLRRVLKADLLTISDEAALQRVRELAREFDAPDLNISHHAQTMSIDELREISSLGVEIANHGWSHLEISHLNHEQVAAHILDGQKWIQQEIGLPAEHYAVPFGTSFVSDAAQVLVRGITMLANSSLPQGELRPGQWNRFELTEELQKP